MRTDKDPARELCVSPSLLGVGFAVMLAVGLAVGLSFNVGAQCIGTRPALERHVANVQARADSISYEVAEQWVYLERMRSAVEAVRVMYGVDPQQVLVVTERVSASRLSGSNARVRE